MLAGLFEVKETGKKGKGLFAKEPIPKPFMQREYSYRRRRF